MKIRILSLLLVACLACSCKQSTNEPRQTNTLREVILGMQYGDSVWVVGHKSPDCDAVFSAMTYAALLQRLGINARARVAGPVVCEPLYVLQEAGMQTPAILPDAAGLDIIMVDHSELAQAVDGMAAANILHIIDHHATGSVTTANPLFYYAMPIGSTCSIVATMYQQLGEQPTAAEARLMLSGLLSDTDSLTSKTTLIPTAGCSDGYCSYQTSATSAPTTVLCVRRVPISAACPTSKSCSLITRSMRLKA